MSAESRWYSRGRLPHIEAPGRIQFVTWSVEGAITPADWQEIHKVADQLPKEERSHAIMRMTESLLDQGKGKRPLANALVARQVQESLLFGNPDRYQLYGWAIMPTHVHCLLRPSEGFTLARILKSLKSYTAKSANETLKREGKFWQTESFDRLIRSPEHFRKTLAYINWNPVKAGLVDDPKLYRYSSAHPENLRIIEKALTELLNEFG